MPIPTFAITGFIDSGKTTFLNQLLNNQSWKGVKMLIIQFESGDEDFKNYGDNCLSITILRTALEQQPDLVTDRIASCVRQYKPEMIWVEWNGMMPFLQLYSMFLTPQLKNVCKIEKVVHIADDCTSVPVMKGLVKKGIPLPAAVTFMTAAPVINPVVMLSSYYAFGGSIAYMRLRVCFGIITSILIGLSFYILPLKQPVLLEGALDRMICSCGFQPVSGSGSSLKEKLRIFFVHSQSEFYYVGKYLVAGAIMGFLVFGPMIDIKNVLMLLSGFSKSFVIRLSVTAFAVCFLSVFIYFNYGGI